MKDEVKDAINTIAPWAKALAKLAENADKLEAGDEHLKTMAKRLEEVRVDFEKISKAVESAKQREQEALMGVNTAKKAADDALATANKEIASMRSSLKIEMDKARKEAKGEYDEYLRALEMHKANASEELRKLEALIEQRKKDHKTIEDSLKSIRKRIDA